MAPRIHQTSWRIAGENSSVDSILGSPTLQSPSQTEGGAPCTGPCGSRPLSALQSSAAGAIVQNKAPQPYTFFKEHIELSDEEVRAIQSGTPVTKVLETDVDNEVAIFGAVWVGADPAEFMKRQRDIEAFETGDAVVAIKKLSEPPELEDFAAVRLPEDDLDALAECDVGDCDVKIDADALERLQRDVDWSAADAHDRASELIREILWEHALEYRKIGDAATGARRDKKRPVLVEEQFDAMLENSPYLLEYVPRAPRLPRRVSRRGASRQRRLSVLVDEQVRAQTHVEVVARRHHARG